MPSTRASSGTRHGLIHQRGMQGLIVWVEPSPYHATMELSYLAFARFTWGETPRSPGTASSPRAVIDSGKFGVGGDPSWGALPEIDRSCRWRRIEPDGRSKKARR